MSYTMKDFDKDRARWLAEMQEESPSEGGMQFLKWFTVLGVVVFLLFFFVIGPALY